MHAVFIVAIVFSGIVVALAVVGATILMAMKLRRSGGTGADQKSQAEEARIIQELYQGFSRMEERVEALETILLDGKGKASSK